MLHPRDLHPEDGAAVAEDHRDVLYIVGMPGPQLGALKEDVRLLADTMAKVEEVDRQAGVRMPQAGLRKGVWRAANGGGLLLLAGWPSHKVYLTTLQAALRFEQLIVLATIPAAILTAYAEQPTGVSFRHGIPAQILMVAVVGAVAFLRDIATRVEVDRAKLLADTKYLRAKLAAVQRLADKLAPIPTLQRAADTLAVDAEAVLASLRSLR